MGPPWNKLTTTTTKCNAALNSKIINPTSSPTLAYRLGLSFIKEQCLVVIKLLEYYIFIVQSSFPFVTLLITVTDFLYLVFGLSHIPYGLHSCCSLSFIILLHKWPTVAECYLYSCYGKWGAIQWMFSIVDPLNFSSHLKVRSAFVFHAPTSESPLLWIVYWQFYSVQVLNLSSIIRIWLVLGIYSRGAHSSQFGVNLASDFVFDFACFVRHGRADFELNHQRAWCQKQFRASVRP